MFEIFLNTLPFFAIIGLGYWAAAKQFFPPEATEYLTRFVFYFALSAMLFGFTANLSFQTILNWNFIAAYLCASVPIYLLAMAVALKRSSGLAEAAVEAQCAVIGNVGFLGIPMLSLLLSEAAVASIVIVLVIDLIVFGSLIVILITIAREGRMRFAVVGALALGLLKNPMIVSISAGLIWSATEFPIPRPMDDFLGLLGAAATPGALFAIGISLAGKSTERLSTAAWLAFCKLVLHPASVAVFALLVFDVEPFAAAVMIAAASLPVAGNVYILAQHYGVAPQRVSASILVSTTVSILTVSAVVAWATVGLQF